MPSKKVMFIFAGTGGTAQDIKEAYQNIPIKDDIIKVYFNGCHDASISGRSMKLGYLNPNLDIVAEKIRACFDTQNHLSIPLLEAQFGVAILVENKENDINIEIDELYLTGFSRGAVTTFSVARHLKDIDIPLYIFAQEPVSGESKLYTAHQHSEFQKNYDLRGCSIKHAEIIVGAYRQQSDTYLNRTQNKYFRQMVPKFNEQCDVQVILIPKSTHQNNSYLKDDHMTNALSARGYLNQTHYHRKDKYQMFFVPKIMRQQFHIGVEGRTQLSRFYKKAIHESVYRWVRRDQSVKIGQAMYALLFSPDFADRNALFEQILQKNNVALREFIVEFENINQFVFQLESTQSDVSLFRQQIYEGLNTYINSPHQYADEKTYIGTMLQSVELLNQPERLDKYKKMRKLMIKFTEENILFHPDLSVYIDESETFQSNVNYAHRQSPDDIIYSKDLTADELIRSFYFLSEKRRANAYQQCSRLLPDIIKSVAELAAFIRFVPKNYISTILHHSQLKHLIQTPDDILLLLRQSFNEKQQKIIYHSVKKNLYKMHLTEHHLAQFKEYISSTSYQELVKKSSSHIPLTEKSSSYKGFFKIKPNLKNDTSSMSDLGSDYGDIVEDDYSSWKMPD